MKRFLAMSALVALAGTTAAQAQEAEQFFPLNPGPAPITGSFDESPTLWFVELKGSPKADGGDAAALAAARQSFRNEASGKGILFQERFAYENLFNGLSLSLKASDVATLRTLPSVKAVYAVESVSLPPTESGPSPDLATAIAQTQADIAQNSLGLTGAGIRVAVMDTGIDFDNPDLGGCFGPGCRVEIGYDFVGDAYNNDSTSPTYNPVPTPDAVPDDCGGHGTHVSGIVGANGVVKGVAPGVTFGGYRVFGCDGSTSADIMVAAMEKIAEDGADILNMSIGSAYQWPQYPTAQAANRLVDQGIVVVASAGNNGPQGLYATGAPGLGEKVISVASFDNTHIQALSFTVSPDNAPVGYFQATAAPAAPTSGTFTLTRTGTTASTADACSALPAGSLTGMWVLIRRGTCSFNIKSINAQNAGAAGVIIYNNVPGIQNITVAGPPQVLIPVVSVSQASGTLLNGRVAAGATTITWTNQRTNEPNTTGNTISGFSSYGLSPTLDIKPDIAAPGGQIFSTYPLEKGGHAIISGTSMASPHTAGAVALLLQAHPGLTPEEVRTVLQNTADQYAWWGNPGLGLLDNVHRQGAGMVRIVDAVQATATVTPSKLALGEVESGSATRTLTIHNNGASAVTYNVTHRAALATGPSTYTVSFPAAYPSTVAFSTASVTVPAGGIATVDATVTPNAGLAARSLFGGYITFTPTAGGQTLSVPFAGFKGDYQGFQVMTPTTNGFPWLAKIVGTSYVNQPAGASYTLVGNDVPVLLVHFDHQIQKLNVEVRKASNGQPVHPVFYYAIEEEFLPRNSTATSFFSFAWNGTRNHNNGNDKVKEVPNGQYVLVIKALKALGDENNPAHWETWTSPVVTLARP